MVQWGNGDYQGQAEEIFDYFTTPSGSQDA
jgi:hypothetical protein